MTYVKRTQDYEPAPENHVALQVTFIKRNPKSWIVKGLEADGICTIPVSQIANKSAFTYASPNKVIWIHVPTWLAKDRGLVT